MAVDASIRDQPDKVERSLAIGGRLYRVHQGGVLEEGAIGDRVVDLDQVLFHHAAAAESQVSDFGVAHLAIRQADRQAGSAYQGVRLVLP